MSCQEVECWYSTCLLRFPLFIWLKRVKGVCTQISTLEQVFLPQQHFLKMPSQMVACWCVTQIQSKRVVSITLLCATEMVDNATTIPLFFTSLTLDFYVHFPH